jgi:hypothetical protein
MLISVQKAKFEALNPHALAWVCIEPTMQQSRAKDLSVKSRIYNQLTTGQRALYMFWVLYGHANNGILPFCTGIASIAGNIWEELKKSFAYFGDEAMRQLVEEMETLYHKIEARNHVFSDFELLAIAKRLDSTYHLISPAALVRVADYIRCHPDEFVYFEG